MRKLTRQLVILFVVFVIYFGYTTFVDGLSLFHTNFDLYDPKSVESLIAVVGKGTAQGTSTFDKYLTWTNDGWQAKESFIIILNQVKTTINAGSIISVPDFIGGFWAANSLTATILAPFKLVLVGGVFAMLVPLTKTIFFGTVIGIKSYLKSRRSNILFNYQNAIKFTSELHEKLVAGDFEQVKAAYGSYNGLALKPAFLVNMMDEIGDVLIVEGSLKKFIQPCEVVVNSLKEMYEKERRNMLTAKQDEMFFDFKRGYEYTSIGSKYSIAYYKAIDTKVESKSKLAWKLYSLEMFRFYIFFIFAIVPTVIINVILLPLIGLAGEAGNAAPALIIVIWFASAIILHAIFTLTKSSYKNMKKELLKPAITYYGLMIVMAITLAIGINGIIAMGPITAPGSSSAMMTIFFSRLGVAVLSTCLIMYVISTLMDANKAATGMTKKVILDGVILPLIAWLLSTGLNLVGMILGLAHVETNLDAVFSAVSIGVLIAFWVYLSVSGVLLNNIVIPSRKKRVETQQALAAEGKAAQDKSEAKN
ncbi:hypothetical protein ELUMI_v1c03200 [Williamsoniiplasma luminosum]|uniref:Uncharacterized protein n=1 Tax=Williamsoniiplasma luminosum TaxID=214888 RepID=A0A2K8NT71_9MOLU|nr:hypothetical protein [Williamsoniiplasma luminosum]ATZ17045.1 hypothetical protein ELUMI_v1c03200 [Williamsoniiplasma luminosum]